MKCAFVIVSSLLVAATMASSCGVTLEERRQALRDEAIGERGSGMSRQELIDVNVRILRGYHPEYQSPSFRWQAAANLGRIGDIKAYNVLWEYGLSNLSFGESPILRRECIVSISKLPFEGPGDERRVKLIEELEAQLRERVNDDSPGIQFAMVGSIITLGKPEMLYRRPYSKGFRDAAFSLVRIAERFSGDAITLEEFISRGLDDRITAGLAEAAIEGLLDLTALDREVARAKRASIDRLDGITLREYFEWWSEEVNALPPLDSFSDEPDAS